MIKHVDFDDEGDYTCEASNGVGIAQSYSIQLKVWGVQSRIFLFILSMGVWKGEKKRILFLNCNMKIAILVPIQTKTRPVIGQLLPIQCNVPMFF